MEKVSIELNQSEGGAPLHRGGFLERVIFIILIIVPFLLPLFFIPSNSFPVPFSKMILLSIGVIVALGCWIVGRLRDGHFVLPSRIWLFSGLGVIAVSILSALFSGSLTSAFVGQTLEAGTVASVAIFFTMMFLVPTVFKSKDLIFYAYISFFAVFFILAAFHGARLLLGPGFLSLGIFTDITSNTVGKWNDLAVFFGVGTVLSLVTLELISLSRFFKILAYVALVVSLFFLAVINFTQVWYITALFGLIFLVYVISFDKSEEFEENIAIENGSDTATKSNRKVPPTSLAVLIVSLLFILGGNTIGDAVSGIFKINSAEARLSWTATLDVTKKVLSEDPLLGAGPNRFRTEWLKHKPEAVNSTVFWNAEFDSGVGFVPTFLATTGILGAVSWLLFLGTFLFLGFRGIFSSSDSKISRYLITSSFLVALFLWIINVFYTPSLSIISLSFFFTGLFVATLHQGGVIQSRVFSFTEDPKKGFVSVLALVLILIGAVTAGYAFVEKFIAAVSFQKGVIAFNSEGNVDKAEKFLVQAIAFDATPAYYQALTQIDILRLSRLLAQDSNAVSADALRTQFQNVFSSALNHGQQAVELDRTNYQSWYVLGQVYEAVVPLKIPNSNAYESAKAAYEEAFKYNPKSPALLLTLARLEASHGNNAKAKEYIARSLQQKNNYTDAIFLLAQIQVAEGNLKDAISSVEAASILAPNDSGVFFQLGLLRYNVKDFSGAVSAFSRAVEVTPSYANAKYFLGLSYQRLGRVEEAIGQFKDLKVTNPDNAEIDLILKNLSAGKNPFTNAAPPIDSQPEKRPSPPVPEKEAQSKKSSSPSKTSDDSSTL